MTFKARTWIGRSLLALLVLLALSYSMTPIAVRGLVTAWLEQQGLQAQFDYLELAPGAGRVVVHGVTGQNAQGRGFALESLTLDIALLPLRQQKLVVENIAIRGGRLDLYKSDNDWEVAGLSLSRLGAASGTEIAETSGAEQQPGPEEIPGAEPTPPWQLDVNGFSLHDLEVCLRQSSPEFYQCLGLDEFLLEGGAHAVLSATPEAELPRQLALTGLRLDDRGHKRQTFGFDGLSLSRLSLAPAGITIGELALYGVNFAERLPEERAHQQHSYHGSLALLRLDTLSLGDAGSAVAAVDLEGLNLLLHRNEAVRFPLLNLIDQLTQPFADPAEGESTETESTNVEQPAARGKPAPNLRIDNLRIGKNSRLSWIDEGVKPTAAMSLEAVEFSLSDLDSAKPGRMSPLSLTAKLGDFGALSLSGGIAPLAPKLNLEMAGEVKALDLAPLTAYTEASIAYRITKGQLNQTLQLKVVDDQLDSVVDTSLHKFDIRAVENTGSSATAIEQAPAATEPDSLAPPEADKPADAGNLPLGVALNLLRDSDDRIRLKLPIKGDIHDPELSFNHIVGVVARKALTEAVISYYTPFGMVSLASMLAESATKLRFEPLIYTPGQSRPNATVRQRLDKLAALLGEREQLSLSFCPIANGSDWSVVYGQGRLLEDPATVTPPQREGLKALAEERAKSLKTLLLEKGVATEQVVVCAAEVNLVGDQPPRVTVSI